MANWRDLISSILRQPAGRCAGKMVRVHDALAEHGFPLTPAGVRHRANFRKLAALKGIHDGRRAFVIGNGPSLRVEDVARLKGEITFGANRIFLMFDRTDWRPTYYMALDDTVAGYDKDIIRRLPLQKLYSSQAAAVIGPDPGAVIVRALPNPTDAEGREIMAFSDDLRRGAYAGYSVLYLGLQAAACMGLREVFLLGVDFHFSAGRPAGEKSAHNEELWVSQGEINHFSPDYRKPGERWTMPRLEEQREAFLCARRYFESHGGRLINASRQTKLEVLERMTLDEILR